MAPPVSPGPAAPPGAATGQPALDRLLVDLRRGADDAPDATPRALLHAAADALEREAGAHRAAERGLADLQEQVDLLEHLAGIGSWEMDMASGRITWSREQRRIHGFPPDRSVHTQDEFLAVVHADDRARLTDVIARLAETGEPFHVEFRVVRPDGQVRLLQSPGRIVPGADGRGARMIGISHDITERRATEQALRANAASYRTIFQHASDAMWLHELETGAFLEVNDAACEMYGYSADEQKAIGLAGLSAGVAPYTIDDARAYVERAAAGEPQRFEWLGRRKDGSPVWGEVRLRRVQINGVDRILATARDINARVAAEAALRAANEDLERRVAERTTELAAANAALRDREAQLSETQRHARLGSWRWDAASGAVEWDEALCAAFGFAPEEAPRDLAGYLAVLHPEDLELAQTLIGHALQTGEPYLYEYRVLAPDGGGLGGSSDRSALCCVRDHCAWRRGEGRERSPIGVRRTRLAGAPSWEWLLCVYTPLTGRPL